MQISKAIQRRLAIGLLVVFTSPLVLRSLHYTFVKHDFFAHHSKEVQFHVNEVKFCAFHHDVFSEYVSENDFQPPLYTSHRYNTFIGKTLKLPTNLFSQLQTRAPPFNYLFYNKIY